MRVKKAFENTVIENLSLIPRPRGIKHVHLTQTGVL